MKIKKIVASAITATFFAVSVIFDIENINAAQEFGITYDSSACTARFCTGGVMHTYNSEGALIGNMYYTLGRLRSKTKNSNNTYQDALVIRMQMDPQKGVKTKYGTIYGVSEYLKVTAYLPTNSINDWSPKNEPNSSTWNIGLNLGADSNGMMGGVSASTDITREQLDYEASVEISKKKATFIYDYKPYKSVSWSNTKNKYVRDSSMQYAMVSYNSGEYKSLELSFNSNFTYADDKYAKPCNVVFGSQKGASNFVWNIK